MITGGVVTYKDILKWKQDFKKLVEYIRAQQFKDRNAPAKKQSDITDYFETWIINLSKFLTHDLGIKHWQGHLKTPVEKMFETFKNAIGEAVWYLHKTGDYSDEFIEHTARLEGYPDAQKLIDKVESNMDFYINNTWKNFGVKGSGIKDDLVKTAEKFWTLLRELITRTGYEEEGLKKATTPDIPETFAIGRLNLYNAIGLEEPDIKKNIGYIQKAYNLAKKYIPEVLYGDVYLELRPSYKIQLGDKLLSVGGEYKIAMDTVHVYFDKPTDLIKNDSGIVLIHELAHRYYYKFMDASQRQQYKYFFDALRREGVTEYSGKNEAEDFAETMTYYVLNQGYMKEKDARDRLIAVLKGKKMFAALSSITKRLDAKIANKIHKIIAEESPEKIIKNVLQYYGPKLKAEIEAQIPIIEQAIKDGAINSKVLRHFDSLVQKAVGYTTKLWKAATKKLGYIDRNKKDLSTDFNYRGKWWAVGDVFGSTFVIHDIILRPEEFVKTYDPMINELTREYPDYGNGLKQCVDTAKDFIPVRELLSKLEKIKTSKTIEKYKPPAAKIQTMKSLYDLLKSLVEDTRKEMFDFWYNYNIKNAEALVDKAKDKRISINELKGNDSDFVDYDRAANDILNVRLKTDYKQRAEKIAERVVEDVEQQFLAKSVNKLAAIVEKRGDYQSAKKVQIEYIKGGAIEGIVQVNFQNGDMFSVKVQVVTVMNQQGTVFSRYPMIFQDIKFGDKRLSAAPEKWMNDVFSAKQVSGCFMKLSKLLARLDKETAAKIKKIVATAFKLPQEVPAKQFKIVGDMGDAKNWKAEVLLANSGDENMIGKFDGVRYIMISLKDNTIIPIPMADEHKSGYDLLWNYYKSRYGINPANYYSMCSWGTHYVYNKEDADELLVAGKKFIAYGGGEDLEINGGNEYRDINTTLKEFLAKNGEIESLKLKKGGISTIAEKFLSGLDDIAKAIQQNIGNPSKSAVNKTFIKAETFFDWVYETFSILLPLSPDKRDYVFKALKEAKATGDLKVLEDYIFGFKVKIGNTVYKGWKNTIHQNIRKAIKEKDGYDYRKISEKLGDPEALNKLLGKI